MLLNYQENCDVLTVRSLRKSRLFVGALEMMEICFGRIKND